MSTVKNHKILWGVLFVFLGLNVWLLYGKIKLQQQVNTLQAGALKTEGAVSQLSEPIRFTGSTGTTEKPVSLVALFTDYGCTSCVVSEIEYLNKWQHKFKGILQVYNLGSSEEYLEGFNAAFDYQQIESANTHFSVSLPVGNPIIAMIDQNGYVQAIHTNDLSRPGSDRRRAQFYERAHSLASAVYERP